MKHKQTYAKNEQYNWPYIEVVASYRNHNVPILLSYANLSDLAFYVLERPRQLMILGLPWLNLHNPVMDWTTVRILQWGRECASHKGDLRLGITSIKIPKMIPLQYHDLADVFSVSKAVHLPPHRPWDCGIGLLLGKEPPCSCVYPLSKKETGAMEEYISEALRQGYIRWSRLPTSASFFFIEKKDGGLRPCIVCS